MTNDVNTPRPVISTQRFDIDLMNPDHATFDIEDLSYAMIHIARYNGHIPTPINILQHSMFTAHVARFDCAQQDKTQKYTDALTLACLLHDAIEAVTGDIDKPLKMFLDSVSKGAISAMEYRLNLSLCRSLGLPPRFLELWLPTVKQYDKQALSAEVFTLWPDLYASGRWGSLQNVPPAHAQLVRGINGDDAEGLRAAYVEWVLELRGKVLEKWDQ
jgi:5'-deoxynucleotidase YfbR-like HD superfamily hydrolase